MFLGHFIFIKSKAPDRVVLKTEQRQRSHKPMALEIALLRLLSRQTEASKALRRKRDD